MPAIAVAAGVCGSLLGLLLWRGSAWLPLDQPNARSLHARPVPRVGGLALMAGLVAGGLLAGGNAVLLASAVVLALVSLADDLRGLPVPVRLAAHLLAAAAVVLGLSAGAALPAVALAIALIAWMTNLFNFMDGADGLAGGMALLGFGAYGVAARAAGADAIAGLAWCAAAAAAGFLVFNFHPAKVFLGDCGSIPLGFLAGGLGWLGWHEGVWPAWFPAVAFAPFVIDASATLGIRLRRGERVWHAHREHYYQRMVRIGWGHRRTALVAYLLMGLSAALALALRTADGPAQAVGLATLALAFVVLMRAFDRRWTAFLARKEGDA